jgi:DNA-binding transcriptional LysR family regulator
MVLIPKLAEFTTAYPEVKLEVTASNDPIDLVAESFDAGIAIGEFIQKDMIAVRVSGDLRLALVGTPAYLAKYPAPQNPRDLKEHRCIGFRFSSGLYRWEFEKGRRAVTVSPEGPITYDDSDLVLETVLKDIGLGMHLEGTVRPLIEQGQLVEVLKDWSPKFPGHFLYYPSRRNQPAALAALIQSLRISE